MTCGVQRPGRLRAPLGPSRVRDPREHEVSRHSFETVGDVGTIPTPWRAVRWRAPMRVAMFVGDEGLIGALQVS
jgi:hypothetical protein